MDWQQAAVLAAIGASAVYLVWRARRKAPGCGGCAQGGCSAPQPAAEDAAVPLVQLELTARKK